MESEKSREQEEHYKVAETAITFFNERYGTKGDRIYIEVASSIFVIDHGMCQRIDIFEITGDIVNLSRLPGYESAPSIGVPCEHKMFCVAIGTRFNRYWYEVEYVGEDEGFRISSERPIDLSAITKVPPTKLRINFKRVEVYYLTGAW